MTLNPLDAHASKLWGKREELPLYVSPNTPKHAFGSILDGIVEFLGQREQYVRGNKACIIRQCKGNRLAQDGPAHVEGSGELLLVSAGGIAQDAYRLCFQCIDDQR